MYGDIIACMVVGILGAVAIAVFVAQLKLPRPSAESEGNVDHYRCSQCETPFGLCRAQAVNRDKSCCENCNHVPPDEDEPMEDPYS